MRLVSLRVRRLPGIDEPFDLEAFSPGVSLLLGPNGSGKTSLCRAILATLWPGDHGLDPLDVETAWRDGDVEWHAEGSSRGTRWRRNGQPSPAPPLPEAHMARCYLLGLRDLLDDAGATGTTLAHRVRVQMAGGYDVEQVSHERFSVPARPGRQERSALLERRRELTEIETNLRLLADHEDGKAALERELDAARSAREERIAVTAALELAQKTEELARRAQELAALPPGLAHIAGNENERLDELNAQLRARLAEQAETEEELEIARRAASGLDFPGDEPSPEVIDAWRRRALVLQSLERDRERARERLTSAGAGLHVERARLGAIDPARETRVTDDELESVESMIRERQREEIRLKEIDERIRLLSAEVPTDDAEDLRHRGDTVQQGVRWLQRWLRQPAPRQRRRPLWIGLATSIALTVVGMALALTVDPRLALLAVFSGGFVLALLPVALDARLSRRQQDHLRHEYERLGLEPPVSWTPVAVERALHALESEAVGVEIARRRLSRCEDLREERQEPQRKLERLALERTTLREELGIDARTGDLILADIAEAVRRFRVADSEHRSASAELARLDKEHGEAVGDLNEFQQPFDGGPATEDAAGALARLDALESRREALRRAKADARGAERRLTTIRDALAELEAQRHALFAGLSLEDGDRDALNLLIARRGEHRAIAAGIASLEARVAELRSLLAQRDDLTSLPVERIQGRIERDEKHAGRYESLVGEIKRIEADVRSERHSGRLEDALAAVHEAHDALVDARERTLHAAAGAFLLHAVEEQHRQRSQPQVLREANRLLAAFTGHRYELRLPAGTDAREFHARDSTTGRDLALSQLSDGTRVQLQLAARVAFTSASELGCRLPLLLDEALTNSDPARFDAVADALTSLDGRDARQVLYLSADPIDVERWRRACARTGLVEPTIVDLVRVRGIDAVSGDLAGLELPDPRVVPPPGDRGPAEYATALQVPRLAPFAPAESAHLFYALYDESALLHRLLVLGISHVGPWRLARRLGRSEELIDERDALRVDAFVELLEAFLDAWREGRGRPVGRAELEACGAISERFLPRLVSLAQDVGGCAEAFVDAMRAREDERVKGFRVEKLGELERSLKEGGHLDERQPLDEEEICLRGLAAASGSIREGTVTESDVITRVAWLHAILSRRPDAGGGAAGSYSTDLPPREPPPPRPEQRPVPPRRG